MADDDKKIKLQSERILQEKASAARKKLMTRDLIFFGINLYKYNWTVDMACPDYAGAYVRFNPTNLGDVEAGSIFLNGKLVAKPEFTHMNLTWYLLHEVLHIINGHGLRMGNKDRTMWNFATDHVIECFLKSIYDNEVSSGVNNKIEPPGGIEHANIIERLRNELPDINAEEAYDWIMKNQPQFEVIDQGGSDNGSGEGGSWVKIKDKKTGREYVVSDPKYNKAQKKAAKDAQSEARAVFNSIKDRGDMSAGISRYLEDILRVEIPWTLLLEKAIKQNVILKPTGRSWRNINKYYSPHGMTLPGVEYEEENEGVGTIIVGVDTSGSISKKETQQFAAIITDSVKYFKKVFVMVHDINVHQMLEYTKDNILEFGKMLKDTGFAGGGGTSHKPLFTQIEEMWEDDPDDISMFISLTDGYSDIEHIWEKFVWSANNNIPTFFVITKSGTKVQEVPSAEFEQIQINDAGSNDE